MQDRSEPHNSFQEIPSPGPDAIQSISGLVYQVLKPGTGDEPPGAHDLVEILYKGWTERGQLLESTGETGTSQTFAVNQLMPGLIEAIQVMTVEQKLRVWIPPSLASSALQQATQGTLIFEIELVGITRVPDDATPPINLTSPSLPK